MKLYLSENPKSAIEKKENKEYLKLAEDILSIRKSEFLQGKYNIRDKSKYKRPFLDYFIEKTEEKKNSEKNYGVWTSALHHLRMCISPNLLFEEVDENFVRRVRRYFDQEAKTKSDLSIAQNSKYSYYNKFKACLRSAYDEGYTAINYASKGKAFEQAESKREYLTFDELQRLISTPCKYPVLKSAFVFSCLSGLRWSDCNTLTWSEVRDEGETYSV